MRRSATERFHAEEDELMKNARPPGPAPEAPIQKGDDKQFVLSAEQQQTLENSAPSTRPPTSSSARPPQSQQGHRRPGHAPQVPHIGLIPVVVSLGPWALGLSGPRAAAARQERLTFLTVAGNRAMTNKSLFLVGFVAAVAGGSAALVISHRSRHESARPAAEAAPLFPGLRDKVNDVAKIRVKRGTSKLSSPIHRQASGP